MVNIVKAGIFSNEKLNSTRIRKINDQVLLAPGTWNGRNYSVEEIEKAFKLTDWNDKDVISLIADHNDDDNKGRPLTIRDWLGFISNPHLDQDGAVRADLNICDSDLATKLIDGKAKFGVSSFVSGTYNPETNSQVDFIFRNNAIVVEPACKKSFINSYLSDDELNEELKDLSNENRIEKRLGKLSETSSKDIQGSEIESKGLQPIKKKKKKVGPGGHIPDETGPHGAGAGPGKGKADGSGKLDLIELEGGKKNMAEKEEEKTEEVKEEEKPTEESTEEEKVEEKVEPKEEISEEESEEKLLDNIAKMTEKLLSKRKMTPEQSKLSVMEKEISLLKDKVAKLEQEKLSESKLDLSKEKLSAKPKSIAGTKLEKDNSFSFGGNSSMKGSEELAAMMNLI